MVRIHPHPPTFAGMAELADAHGSGPCGVTPMQVQVLFPAPWRVVLQYLRCCKATLFLYGNFTGGVADGNALAGLRRDLRRRQRWNIRDGKRAHAVVAIDNVAAILLQGQYLCDGRELFHLSGTSFVRLLGFLMPLLRQ